MEPIELISNPSLKRGHVWTPDNEQFISFNNKYIIKPYIRFFHVPQLSFAKILKEAECSFCKELFNMDIKGWGGGFCPSCNSDYNSGWRKKK